MVNYIQPNGLNNFMTTEEFNNFQIENRNEYIPDQIIGFWYNQDFLDWLHKFTQSGQGFFY